MHTDISSHEAWFADFTQGYFQAEQVDPAPIALKITHTAQVLMHARRIIAAHCAFGQDGQLEGGPQAGRPCSTSLLPRAILLAALYHDVGRFPQYARWHTFKDSLSANHGLLGVKTLKAHSALSTEAPALRVLVLAAVGLHNKFTVSTALPPALQYVTHAVRDADKCDIIRIMAKELGKDGPKDKTVVLHVQDAPTLWTPKVVEDVRSGRVAAYKDLRSVNDFKLLLASWLYDLHFAVSRHYLKGTGHIESLLADLPPDAPVQAAKSHVLRQWAVMAQADAAGRQGQAC